MQLRFDQSGNIDASVGMSNALKRAAEVGKLLQRRTAQRAHSGVRRELVVLARSKLAIDQRRERFCAWTVLALRNHAFAFSNREASAARARASRDLTVPSFTPSTALNSA